MRTPRVVASGSYAVPMLSQPHDADVTDVVATAHVDEASARLDGGVRLYAVGAVLTCTGEHPKITQALTDLQLSPGLPLHFRTEQAQRRVLIAEALATLPLDGGIVLHTATTDSGQEHARTRLLGELLPRLEHVEGFRHVVLESRGGGDRHDRRTLDRLRRSRRVSAALRVDHAEKTVPLLWTADFVASSYVAAVRHGETEPWDVISAAHFIEVVQIPG